MYLLVSSCLIYRAHPIKTPLAFLEIHNVLPNTCGCATRKDPLVISELRYSDYSEMYGLVSLIFKDYASRFVIETQCNLTLVGMLSEDLDEVAVS